MAESKKAGRNRSSNNFWNTYSSRIDKVAIPLCNYNYYHGPSDEKFHDHRVIGRKRIKEKIKSLFTQSEFPTGVYLITGYRGSGKTSIVNEVIDDVENNVKLLKGKPLWYYLILSIYILSAYCINYNIINLPIIFYSLLAINTIFIGTILFLTINFRDYFSRHKSKRQIFLNFFIFLKDPVFNERHHTLHFINWIIFFSLPYYCLFLYVKCITWISFELNTYNIINFLALCFYSMIIANIIYNIALTPKNKIRDLIFGVFRLNKYFFIKLNLGHAKLKEIDILRLLARNLKNQTHDFYKRKYLSKLVVNVLGFYFLYSCTYLYYNITGLKSFHYSLSREVGITDYLPSQDPIYINSNDKLVNHKSLTSLFDKARDFTRETPVKGNIQGNYINQSGLKAYKHITAFEGLNSNNNYFEHKTVIEYTWEKISFGVKVSVRLVDISIYTIYGGLRNIILDGLCFNSVINKKIPIEFIAEFLFPKHLDYSFLLYMLSMYLLLKHLVVNRMFSIKSPSSVLRKIDHLNDIIISEISVDRPSLGGEKSNFNIVSFFSPKSKKRPIADVREIEKFLIEIFDDIDNIRLPYVRPVIGVILDELDKIETHTQAFEKANEEPKDPDLNPLQYSKKPNPSFTIDGTRERQQSLQIMLSNLKYFLSDAKAKFIFIAGRELYDASLADISDRNYFMGSIFHDVIYINSFFSDLTDKKPSDITSLIEKYVCQFIIPENYIHQLWKKEEANRRKLARSGGRAYSKDDILVYYTLANYNRYLIENFIEFNDSIEKESVSSKVIARQKREKIITTLQKFIVYLTHASNGAPKKVTNYFENFIEYTRLEDSSLLIPVDRKKLGKNGLDMFEYPYLIFDFNKQYELGLINYITVPIILSISNHIKNYSDKILVSATYLFDHMIKFHRDGFSWRNIEYIPEILEINKTPELRSFIGSIIQFLTQTHLEVILSGLYNYRFNQRLSNEISFLSRISEEASAAFNFTLDESLAIKHYYHSLLYRLEDRYKRITTERTKYIHSISMVHVILGDLYYYDEEYNDAALEYLDSIQFLRYTDLPSENPALLLILVRSMLKLGLAYEKRKTYDAAYETFKEITYLLIKHRDIDISQLGLEEKSHSYEQVGIPRTFLSYPNISYYEANSRRPKSIRPVHTVFPDEIALVKNFNQNFPGKNIFEPLRDLKFSEKESFIPEITKELNPNVEKIINKVSSFEGLRLIYQPLLAKLQMMEKCILGGITMTDVWRIEKEFYYLQKAISHQDKYLLSIEFYNRIGDILFFKKGNIKFNLTETVSGTVQQDEQQHVDGFKRKCNGKNLCTECGIECNDNQEQRLKNRTEGIGILGHDQPIPGKVEFNLAGAACMYYQSNLLYFLQCNGLQIQPVTSKENKSEKEIKEDDHHKFGIERIYELIAVNYDKLKKKDHTTIRILAGLISDLADSLLACPNNILEPASDQKLMLFFRLLFEEDLYSNQVNFLESVIAYFKTQYNELNHCGLRTFSGIIFQFYISALLYKEANEMKKYTWQLTKIIYLLKDNFINLFDKRTCYDNDEFLNKDLVELLKKSLLNRAIRGSWSSYEYAHMLELPKNKKIMNPFYSDPKKPTPDISLRRISVIADVEEAEILFGEIETLEDCRMDSVSHTISGKVVDYYLNNQISPYSDLDMVYNRMIRLNFKVKLNYRIFNALCRQYFNFGNKYDFDIKYGNDHEAFFINLCQRLLHPESIEITLVGENSQGVQEVKVPLLSLFIHLIGDSIFCLNENIEVTNAYGKTFFNNHSQLGTQHERLVLWIMFYEAIERFPKYLKVDRIMNQLDISEKQKKHLEDCLEGLKNNLENLLKKWIAIDSVESLSRVYHCELAIRRFYSSYETHMEGRAYKAFLENLCFLNDDYNDKMAHFFVAYERYWINQHDLKKRIDDLKNIKKNSSLYDYDNYIN